MSRNHAELGALLVIVGSLWLAAVWSFVYWLVFTLVTPSFDADSTSGTCLCVDLKEKKEECGENE